MYKILENTPFGFIFELENLDCFFTRDYTIYLNNEFFMRSNKNVLDIFGLKPNTVYNVMLDFTDAKLEFQIQTENISYLINVLDYNAKGNGVDDTTPIMTAIYTAPKNSVLYFPKGEYLVNHILLKSDIDIYLEEGCVIKQNYKREVLGVLKGYQKDYYHQEAIINSSWEGNPLDIFCPLIYGKDITNARIYGAGTIDGNGDVSGFWDHSNCKNIAYRPKNIELVNCSNVTIGGITTKNSASWNVHPYYSQNIKLLSLKVKSIEISPNTDGINPESCKNVDIIGCIFSVGDDCIAIKSGKIFMSKDDLHKPCENINIRNCKMEKGHGAVVIGSEISNGVKNVVVSNCYFISTDRGLRIKTRRGRGEKSIVDNIVVKNTKMKEVVHGIVLNMFYYCDPDGHSNYVRTREKQEVTEEIPSIKNITVENVILEDILGVGIFAYGLPEQPIEKLSVKNSKFIFKKIKTYLGVAMLDDFEEDENLGIFIKNVKKFEDENNVYIGDHKKILE
ncbi:MAG: glycoside hydrolase family 28 protein [Lachnospirales bacterium]